MRLAKSIGVLIIAATFCMSVIAQPPGAPGKPGGPGGPGPGPGPGGPGGPGGPPGPQLSEEALAKAWDLQASTVAKQLSLNEEQSTKLAEAYKAARTSHTAAVRERMSSGERRDPGAFREISVSERGKLETALKGFLNEEQTAKALATLGSFNRRWDGMVAVIDGMGLEEKARTDALNAIATHVADSSKVMEEAAAGGGSPESIREKLMPLREKLDADMGKVLNAEQLAKWKESTSMRGGRRGPGQRGDGPPPPPRDGGPGPGPGPGGGSKQQEKKAEE